MSKPNYIFVNLANKKAEGKTLNELRAEKAKDEKHNKREKKEKRGKRDEIDKIYGKAKPFINPNNKILLNTRERLIDNMRENNRTKILMDLEYTP